MHPANRVWTANPAPGRYTLTLAALNTFDADGSLMAEISPVPGADRRSRYWIEYRRKAGWRAGIPRDIVLVHELRGQFDTYLLTRSKSYDALGQAQVLPGQKFEVPLRDLTVKVEGFDPAAATATVTLTIGKPGELSRRLKPVTEYLIVNARSGRVLDAATPAWIAEGARVRLVAKTGEAKQRWNVLKEGKGAVTIMNVADGRLMDADTNTIDRDGTGIAMYGLPAMGTPNRVWKVVPLGNGEVAIVNAQSGRCLDADPDTIDRDETAAALRGTDVKGAATRRWKLVPVAKWPGTAPNLLANGGFEDGPEFGPWVELKNGSTAIKGWTVTGGVLLDRADWEHAEGSNSVLLHSPDRRGGIEQAFDTVKGRRYRVSFALAANPNLGRWAPKDTPIAIRVSAAGQSKRFDFDCAGKMPDNMGVGDPGVGVRGGRRPDDAGVHDGRDGQGVLARPYPRRRVGGGRVAKKGSPRCSSGRWDAASGPDRVGALGVCHPLRTPREDAERC